MKTKLFCICLTLISLTASSQSVVLSDIAQMLNEYYQYYPIEKIQLTTDKEVYKPEEVIWFSMLITNTTGQIVEPISSDVQVGLYSGDGVRIIGHNFKSQKGMMKGDIAIPKGLHEGRYVLVASPASASRANEAFYKLIYINPKNEEAFRLKETTVPTLLVPGKSNNYTFVMEEMDGSPAKNEKLQAELYHQQELVLKQKIKTNSDGKTTVDLSLPDKAFESPLKLTILTKRDELIFSTVLPVKNEQLNVCFYPEGGQLVAGTPQKLGFSVHNELGQPVSVAGEITDENGTRIGQGSTSIPGFGVFPCVFEKEKQYRLRLTSELGENQTFALPKVKETLGLALVRTDADFIYLNLVPATQKPETIHLLANKGENILWASEVELESPMRLKIPNTDFPNGVSLISAFNEDSEMLASRLVYLEKKGKSVLELNAPEKVKAGEVFKFTFESGTPADETPALNLTISADEENLNWPNHWEAWLLFNSDLSKELTDPESLLETKNLETTMNYLLVANRMKNFDWNSITHFDREREQNRHQQSGLFGQVVNKNNEPVPNAKVSFINAQNMQILNSSSDENGEFYQQAINADKLEDFAIKAIGPDGSEDLKVTFKKTLAEQISDQVQSFLQTYATLEQAQFSSDFYQKNRNLFTKIKIDPEDREMAEPAYKKYLQTATSLLEVLKVIKPYRLDGDKIIFPGGTNSINAQDGALIVIDGQKMGTSASVLNSLSPYDVETINVSTSPVEIQRYTGLNSVGLIEIWTKRGETIKQVELQPAEDIFEGDYRIPRDFWLRKSENPKQQSTTLFWSPAVTMNPNGRSEFEVAAGQVLGKFIIRGEMVKSNGEVTKIQKTIEVVP
tara:strand:- start:5789 stop:8341 length:2553 start_codon:yes stop_codon:yes gene_type:complete